MKKLNLNENFISRIWRDKIYYAGLKTTDGRTVEVLDYGILNKDSGADYKNAKISIENNIFCGDIEIHRSLRDWTLHNHKGDGKYNKVVLQVVFWEDDFPLDTALPIMMKSREIPTVILSKFLTKSIHEIWKEIINNPSKEFQLPCYPENEKIDYEQKKIRINNIGLKRLDYRAGRLKHRLETLENIEGVNGKKHYWEKLLFEYTLEALGFSKNKEQFMKFGGLINLEKIKKLNLPQTETEALFFGVSGLLSNIKFKDGYIEQLKKNWEMLREKIKPESMNRAEWNFFRLRPQNFPTVRMAYAASFCRELLFNNLFKRIVMCFDKSKNVKRDLAELFLEIPFSPYWKNHYVFGNRVESKPGSIGEDRVLEIITNVVLPLLYHYSLIFDKDELNKKVISYFLLTKDKNDNEITKVMKKQLFFKSGTISENQGLIHLHNFYCVKDKCGDCFIGNELSGKGDKTNILKIILY